MVVYLFLTSSSQEIVISHCPSQFIENRPHTNQYLQFSSHHPSSHKLSNGRSLFFKAYTHSSSLVQWVEKESIIFQALLKNGYPIRFIKRCQRQLTSKPKPPIASDQKNNQNRYSLCTGSI